MLKRFAQILALATPMLLIACNSGTTKTTTDGTTTTTTTTTSFAGTYTGEVTGLNAGPVTFIVDANNVVTGSFSITNRVADCSAAGRGNTCETSVDGKVDAAGNLTGDFVDSGQRTMHFTGKIVGDSITNGSWGEYIHDPIPDGSFTASRPAGSGGTSTTTATGSGTCEGSYVGSIDAPSKEVRISNRDRQLTETGFAITGNDAIDNANTTGGGVDGGIYLTGSFAFETDVNCNVTKSRGDIFGIPITILGKVNANKTFSLFSPEGGPVVGSVDGNGKVTGQYQEAGKEWVHGVLNGNFVSKGKI